jgi:hypothetical protein
MSYEDKSTNTIFYDKEEEIKITTHTSVVILENEIEGQRVLLPQKPSNQRKIVIFNESGKTLKVDTNSTTDLIYSHMYCPHGEKIIKVENRMVLNYIYVKNPKSEIGKWYIL